jgi:hypothetical protein
MRRVSPITADSMVNVSPMVRGAELCARAAGVPHRTRKMPRASRFIIEDPWVEK